MNISDFDFVKGYTATITYKLYIVSEGAIANPSCEMRVIEKYDFGKLSFIDSSLKKDWNKLEIDIESKSGCKISLLSAITIYNCIKVGQESIFDALFNSIVEQHKKELHDADGIAKLTFSHIKYLDIFAEKLARMLGE